MAVSLWPHFFRPTRYNSESVCLLLMRSRRTTTVFGDLDHISQFRASAALHNLRRVLIGTL